MERNEQLLLLELILRDIRGNWGWDINERLSAASELADALDTKPFITSIKDFREEWTNTGCCDGRYFRMSHTDGGYEGMEELHGLPHTLAGRSEEFLHEARDTLTYPGYRFDDWPDGVSDDEWPDALVPAQDRGEQEGE